jgi:hypothetical protein
LRRRLSWETSDDVCLPAYDPAWERNRARVALFSQLFPVFAVKALIAAPSTSRPGSHLARCCAQPISWIPAEVSIGFANLVPEL